MNKQNSKIKLSVVIPAYNEEKKLPACLESIQKQKIDVAYEIIVVDNNSTDNTTKIAEKYGVRVFAEKKKGVCFARQKGAKEASGEIIVSTDADCVFSSNWLKSIYQVFKEKPNTVAVFGPYRYEEKPKWGMLFTKLMFELVSQYYQRTGKLFYVGASNSAFKKESWLKIGGYNTKLAQGGDENDLLKKFYELGEIIYLPKNIVLTSSRRLSNGIAYSFFITLIVYYVLDYFIIAKLTGRSLFGHWPDYRESKKSFQKNWMFDFASFTLILLLFLSFIFGTGKVYSKNRVITGSHKVMTASKDGVIDVNDGRKNLKNHWHNYRYNYHLKETN